MKTYAEFLRGYISKKGDLLAPSKSEHPHRVFVIKKSPPDFGAAKLVSVGADYAKFEIAKGLRLVPLNLLVLEVE
jgi:hypothetical protein